jgi:hypothetical protein
VEYVDGFIVNDIIHDFKGITGGVKTDNQILVFQIFQGLFIHEGLEGRPDVRPLETTPLRGSVAWIRSRRV